MISLGNKATALLSIADTFGRIIARGGEIGDLRESFVEIANRLFLFASDETIHAYLALREALLNPAGPENGQVMRLYAVFIVAMRNDLAEGESNVRADDFLRMILRDWDSLNAPAAAE